MNFLELVVRTRQECSSASIVPSTVVDQTGMNLRFVNWVAEAWKDLQSMQEYWLWMRHEFSFANVSTDAEYPPYALSGSHAGLSDFARWHTDSFRCYLTSTGVQDEQHLVCWDYQTFRDTYRFGTRQSGRPAGFALRPRDQAVMFDLAPDAGYTFVGDYQIKPVLLAANTDTPAVDDRFHVMIVYAAMIKYGIDQAAAEVIARGQAGMAGLMGEFDRRYLPAMMS